MSVGFSKIETLNGALVLVPLLWRATRRLNRPGMPERNLTWSRGALSAVHQKRRWVRSSIKTRRYTTSLGEAHKAKGTYRLQPDR
jgi:hypothetical protein